MPETLGEYRCCVRPPVGLAGTEMQTKLHRWAVDDPERRFDDLYNLVHHPDFLVVAWERVRGNQGARTAGVDGLIRLHR